MAKGKKTTANKKSTTSKKKTTSKKSTTSKKGSKKSTTTTSKKTASKKKPSKKAEPAPEPETVDEEEDTGPCVADFLDALDQLDEMRKQCTVIKHRFQDLAKYASRLEKYVNKSEQKKAQRKAQNGGKPRARGGIMKEAPISDELAAFLGVDEGTKLTRNEVRNRIHEYAIENDLKEGKMITLDKGLSSIFTEYDGKTIAYNGIIGQIGPHFVASE